MKFKFYCYLTLLGFFLSCSNKTKLITEYSQFRVGLFKLPVEAKKFKSFRTKFAANLNMFFFLNEAENTLFVIDTNGALKNTIKFKESYSIQDYFIQSLDSFFISTGNNELFLLDGNGIQKKYWKINTPIENNSNYITENTKIYPLLVLDNRVYLYYSEIGLMMDKDKSTYFNKSREVIFKLDSTLLLINKSGKFPSSYSSKNFNDYNPIRTNNVKGQLLYSFEASDSIYIYGKDGDYIGGKAISSKYFLNNDEFKESPVNNDKYFYQMDKYMMENTRFKKLIHDQYRNLYYRVLRPKCLFENQDGSINFENSCEWLLLIADENFNLIKTIKFPGNIYNFSGIIVSEKGLMIPLQKNSSQITYEVFSF